MANVWISRAPPRRPTCYYEIAEFGSKILVRFKDPDSAVSHAVQAGVAAAAAEADGVGDLQNVLVALGFTRPVARDAALLITELLSRFGTLHSLPGARDVLRRVEFKQ